MMNVIILAAGRGTRLGKFTERSPKCLVEVAGKTILQRQLDLLASYDLGPVTIVTGYKKHLIEKHIKKISYSDITSVENEEYAFTNNMVSLSCASSIVTGEPFLLMNGDVLLEDEIMRRIIESGESVVPYDSSNFDPEELKLKISNNRAECIKPKPTGPEDSDGSTIGIFQFSGLASSLLFEDIRNVLMSGRRNEWFEHSLSSIFAKTEFQPLNVAGLSWFEIDNEEDLSRARAFFEDSRVTD